MRALWRTAFLAIGTAAASGSAMAADVYRPPFVSAPVLAQPRVYNWSGAYVGLQGGWDNNALSTSLAGGQTATANGGLFGIFGGVNLQPTGNLVFGIDGSINWTNARATTTSPGAFPISAGPTWKGFVRGRLGLAFDRLLVYGTAGGAVMHFEETAAGLGSNTPWGWTAGLGADFAVNDRMFLRLDWAHANFATSTLSPSGVTYANSADTVTAGIGLKF